MDREMELMEHIGHYFWHMNLLLSKGGIQIRPVLMNTATQAMREPKPLILKIPDSLMHSSITSTYVHL